MDDPWLWARIALFAILLLFSAFFSGSETAFFSLNSLEKDSLRRRATKHHERIVSLLFSRPDEVLVTILTGNMFVNVFATSISEALGARFFGEAAELISIVAMTLILLVTGEMTPKNLAIRHSLGFATFAARALRIVHPILTPVIVPLSGIRRLILSAYPERGRLADDSRNGAVLSAIRMGFENNTIDHSELVLLERFFRFREKSAADVMVPRIDAVAIEAGATVGELLALLASGQIDGKTGLIPVYRADLDHICGYVRRSDVVPYRLQNELDARISAFTRPIHAVPAGKQLRELLVEMSDHASELAVVVDEYGGTQGLVSYRAMVDYLFDEFLPPGERSIQTLEDGRYRFAGSVELHDVEDVLGVELDVNSRTVAGLIIETLGELPRAGATAVVSGYRFTAVEAAGHRIRWVEAVAV